MALLDDLNAVRDKLSEVIATVDPATGLPAGSVPGQHDTAGPAAVPDPEAVETPEEEQAEETAETPAVAPNPEV